MHELTTTQWLITIGVIMAAYVVRGLAGFGSGLIATPLLLMFLPLTVAVPLVVVLDYVASAMQGVRDRHLVDWEEVRRLLPTAVVGVAIAFWMLQAVDLQWLVKALAVFLLFVAIQQLRHDSGTRAIPSGWAWPAGAFGGLIGTLFGTGGPFYVAYLQGRRLDKQAFRATFSTIFLLDGANRIVTYALSGFFDPPFLWLLLGMAPVMALGIYIGRHCHANIGQDIFRRGISALLVVSACLLLAK